jgi:CubicO group peptidase (beta-lactamase class C family)
MSHRRLIKAVMHLCFGVLTTSVLVAANSAAALADEPALVGHWVGAIETPGKALAIDVDFSRGANGSWQGDISIPAQGAKDLPVAKLGFQDPELSFELPGVPGNPAFKAKLDAKARRIRGTFSQGGASLSFHLEAAADPIMAAKTALAGFDSFLTEAIKAWEVPGMAVAIVKDGEVVFAQGFGLRDVAHKLPVTPKTLFAIGSCTKAFTTFVLGTLVEEGKLDWDTPVRVYIPEFRLFDRTATEQMTPRDLVTHRSGLPRHDLLWYNATLSGKQIVERLAYLEPSESFRNKFQYNNLMFMTAGYLAERVGGKPWEEAVRARIFQPLGMTGCNFSVKDSQAAPDFAKPYDDRDDKIVEIPFRDITNAGPAGSINSGVSDMARWLVVQTHKGKIDGRQILSAAVLADIHTPHMTMGVPQERKEIAAAGYALGWMVDDYRGHRRVHHGGGIDGFTAQTVLFPEDGLGLCILSNMGGTALPEMVSRHAADRALGLTPIDWSGEELVKKKKGKEASKAAKAKKETARRSGTAPAHKLDEYAGEYEHPGYGVIQIELHDGRLNLSYNQIGAQLAHWHYEVFNALKNPKDPAFEDEKVQFLTNVKGYVDSLAVTMEPRLKPIVFSKRPAARLSDPAFLTQFVGAYELAATTVNVRLNRNSLVLDTPGQASVTLLPDQDDSFKVKEQSGLSIRFVAGKDRSGDALVLDSSGGVFTAKRKKP